MLFAAALPHINRIYQIYPSAPYLDSNSLGPRALQAVCSCSAASGRRSSYLKPDTYCVIS